MVIGVSEACIELVTSTSSLFPSHNSMLGPSNWRLTAAKVRLCPSAEIKGDQFVVNQVTCRYCRKCLGAHDEQFLKIKDVKLIPFQ